MLILFVRVTILYLIVFGIIRLTGKRQISDLQPFDLVITLLIADLASEPAADTGIPLMYGVVPILALFLIHQIVAYLAMKSTMGPKAGLRKAGHFNQRRESTGKSAQGYPLYGKRPDRAAQAKGCI